MPVPIPGRPWNQCYIKVNSGKLVSVVRDNKSVNKIKIKYFILLHVCTWMACWPYNWTITWSLPFLSRRKLYRLLCKKNATSEKTKLPKCFIHSSYKVINNSHWIKLIYYYLQTFLLVSLALSLFIKNIHLFILQNTLLHWFYSLKQFKCCSRFVKSIKIFTRNLFLIIIRFLVITWFKKKVSSEYFNTFYESRRTFELF